MKVLARRKTSGDVALGISGMMLKVFSIKTKRTPHAAAPHAGPLAGPFPTPGQETGSGT